MHSWTMVSYIGKTWVLNKRGPAGIAIGWFMNIGYRLRGDRHCGAWCIHPLASPSLPSPANNVQPFPTILFCPITSISGRTGADVIEFHQVANFALFSTLRQPSPWHCIFYTKLLSQLLLYLVKSWHWALSLEISRAQLFALILIMTYSI